MKKIIKYLFACLTAFLLLSSCKKQLNLSPISSISDASYWKTADQFDAFVSGLHSRFRSHVISIQQLGELRSDIFGTEPGSSSTFTGEATQGVERFWMQNLNLDNPGVSGFGGFYSNIAQLNLLIEKLGSTTVVTTANKNYYLGIAHGMRAYYYFQLTRAWGDVVIWTDQFSDLDLSNLAKPASPAAEVMALIKSDIDKSVTAFGSDYSFRNAKSYWSKAATLMLKAEVYLWTAQKGGGNADATTALGALTDIQTNISSLSLLPNYANVFSTTNRGNNEIIFSVRFLNNESSQPFSGTYYPQTALIANFHAMQFQSGKYRGRIYVAANHSAGEPQPRYAEGRAFGYFSDDHGKTFRISNDIQMPGGNEATAAELSGNRLMMNVRNQKGDVKARIIATSSNGGEKWDTAYFDQNLPDPVCEGSILTIGKKGKKNILAFCNAADTTRRDNLVLRISFDDGKTWNKNITVDNHGKDRNNAAYSDIVKTSDQKIGILYEKDNYTRIVFKEVKWK